MSLYEKVEADMRAALRARDALTLSVLRMLLAGIRYMEIEKKVKTLEDPDICQLLQRQIKQHRDSIEQFQKGGRQDLVDKETKELRILESYLPEQLSEGELRAVIAEAMQQTGAAAKRDAGKVIKAVMEKARGRVEGKAVNSLVMELLK